MELMHHLNSAPRPYDRCQNHPKLSHSRKWDVVPPSLVCFPHLQYQIVDHCYLFLDNLVGNHAHWPPAEFESHRVAGGSRSAGTTTIFAGQS